MLACTTSAERPWIRVAVDLLSLVAAEPKKGQSSAEHGASSQSSAEH